MRQVTQAVLDMAKAAAYLALERGEPVRYTYPVAVGRGHLYFSADADKIRAEHSFTARGITFHLGRRR
jgi:hypothetical protein